MNDHNQQQSTDENANGHRCMRSHKKIRQSSYKILQPELIHL